MTFYRFDKKRDSKDAIPRIKKTMNAYIPEPKILSAIKIESKYTVKVMLFWQSLRIKHKTKAGLIETIEARYEAARRACLSDNIWEEKKAKSFWNMLSWDETKKQVEQKIISNEHKSTCNQNIRKRES